MIEKRRSTRIPVQIHLSISDLFNQDLSGIHDLNSPIEVVDISRHGIGFVTECILPVDYYFNAQLELGVQDPTSIFTIVKIVRFEILDKDLYRYGCEFSNMPENIGNIIETYSERFSQDLLSPDATTEK